MIALARRDFLRVAAAVPFALRPKRAKSCVVIVLTGGPSQLDTWDLKPDAPSEIRGPFRPIRTNVAGIEISEIFPRMAKHADKYAIVRGIYSEATPLFHDDGMRVIDTATEGYTRLSGNFEENCIRARHLVESGTRFVRVDMYDTVFHTITWDSHGVRPFSTIRDYKETVGTAFDRGYSTLLEDLHQRGLLASTLVIAVGEFGRSPRINPMGGRDHWTKCQTALLAGGGIHGGQIHGSSDATGAEPMDNPVKLSEILAGVRRVVASTAV